MSIIVPGQEKKEDDFEIRYAMVAHKMMEKIEEMFGYIMGIAKKQIELESRLNSLEETYGEQNDTNEDESVGPQG